MKKKLALLLSSLMLAGILASCGGNAAPAGESKAAGGETTVAAGSSTPAGSSAPADASAAPAAKDGEKILRFGCQMYSDGLLNPASQTNTAWNAMRFGITESLFKFDDDMKTMPWLAESIESDEAHQNWTIKLKDGIKFSNGNPVTATKVKESLDWIRKEGPNGSTNPQNFLEFEAEVTADDDAKTIKIKTVTPYVNLAGNLADPSMAIVDVADTKDFDTGLIGTGPYMVSKFTDQVGYDMVKNPNYWDGEVPYDGVQILFMGDASAKAAALRAGQIDLAENVMSVSDLKTLKEDPNFTVDITAGVRCGFSWMNFKGVLGNKTLREAIHKAIDYKAICESNTIGGLYTPGFSVLPSSLGLGYDKLKNPYEFDLEGAKKMLDDAGIKDSDGNGIRELDGKDINLTYVSYENRLLNDFSDAHTQYLTELGIGVTPKYGSSDDQWNSLVAGEYDLNNNNWNTQTAGSSVKYMGNWYSKSEANYCGFKNDEYDKLYEELITERDHAKSVELLEKMQQILIDEAVVIVDGYYNSCMVYSKNVGHAHVRPIDYYWISTDIVPAK